MTRFERCATFGCVLWFFDIPPKTQVCYCLGLPLSSPLLTDICGGRQSKPLVKSPEWLLHWSCLIQWVRRVFRPFAQTHPFELVQPWVFLGMIHKFFRPGFWDLLPLFIADPLKCRQVDVVDSHFQASSEMLNWALGLGQGSGWASQKWSQSCCETTALLF